MILPILSLALACGEPGPALGTSGEARAASGPRSQAPRDFWDHWGDGRAELAGYQLVQPRYGELRAGEAVLVTVTETFAHGPRVKSDGGHPDEYPVVKLNEVRDFPTGIYDYNVMTSTFLPLDGRTPRGVPTKLSFSMQEWCGHVYDQLRFDEEGARVVARRDAHSYFDGEADQEEEHLLPEGAISLDAMPMLVRGLTGEVLAPGASRELAVLPRLMDLRLRHQPLEILTGTLSRSAEAVEVTVPAGTFPVERWTLQLGGDTHTWEVGAEAPHPLVRWTGPGGEVGELTGLRRGKYWREHGNGGEALRGELGLPVHLVGAPAQGAGEAGAAGG